MSANSDSVSVKFLPDEAPATGTTRRRFMQGAALAGVSAVAPLGAMSATPAAAPQAIDAHTGDGGPAQTRKNPLVKNVRSDQAA
jgi:nitrous oxide reductase